MIPTVISQFDLLWWIFDVGLLGFILMGIDKAAAKWWNRRIRERNLWLVAFAGGFAGIIIGGLLFHHKIRKLPFWEPIILATIVWTLFFASIVFGLWKKT